MSKPTAFDVFQLVSNFLKRFGIFLKVVWHFLFTWTWNPAWYHFKTHMTVVPLLMFFHKI